MNILLNLLIGGAAVIISAYLLPGVRVDGFWTALIVAIVLALLNTFLKPLLIFLTLPATILTLGLFLFVINAALILLAGKIVPGFHVEGWGWALLFSLILSILHSFLESLVK